MKGTNQIVGERSQHKDLSLISALARFYFISYSTVANVRDVAFTRPSFPMGRPRAPLYQTPLTSLPPISHMIAPLFPFPLYRFIYRHISS